MPFHSRSISSWTCMFLTIFFFLAGCRKTDLSISNNGMQTQTYEQLQTRFFNTTGTDPEIQKLAANFQKHESVFKFLPEFVKKNGIAGGIKSFIRLKTNHQKFVAACRIADLPLMITMAKKSAKAFFLFHCNPQHRLKLNHTSRHINTATVLIPTGFIIKIH